MQGKWPPPTSTYITRNPVSMLFGQGGAVPLGLGSFPMGHVEGLSSGVGKSGPPLPIPRERFSSHANRRESQWELLSEAAKWDGMGVRGGNQPCPTNLYSRNSIPLPGLQGGEGLFFLTLYLLFIRLLL